MTKTATLALTALLALPLATPALALDDGPSAATMIATHERLRERQRQLENDIVDDARKFQFDWAGGLIAKGKCDEARAYALRVANLQLMLMVKEFCPAPAVAAAPPAAAPPTMKGPTD